MSTVYLRHSATVSERTAILRANNPLRTGPTRRGLGALVSVSTASSPIRALPSGRARARQTVAVPIVVRLEDEHGKVVKIADPNGGTCDGAGDFDRLVPFDDASYRCLGVVDPYGDTVFNRLQMPMLLEDLAQLEVSSATATERRGLERLEALARRCMEG